MYTKEQVKQMKKELAKLKREANKVRSRGELVPIYILSSISAIKHKLSDEDTYDGLGWSTPPSDGFGSQGVNLE